MTAGILHNATLAIIGRHYLGDDVSADLASIPLSRLPEGLRGLLVAVISDFEQHGTPAPTLMGLKEASARILSKANGQAKEWKVLIGGGIDSAPSLEQAKANLTAAILGQSTPQEDAVPLFTKKASDITPIEIKWLWPGRFPFGKLTSVAGDPGLGKSCIALSVASTASSGSNWPAGGGHCSPCDVLIANFEDDEADTIVPRLIAMDADLSRIRFLQGVPDEAGRRGFDVNRDTDRLERHLELYPETRLVIIDPISAAMPGTDSHKNSEVRAALHPLADLAQRLGICILTVTHLNKGGGSALHRVTGSIAFTAAARVAYIVAKDDKDPTGEQRLFLPIKNNLGDDRTGLSYTVEKKQVAGGIESVWIAWRAELVTTSADQALVRDEERGAGRDAEAFLIDILNGGPVPVQQILSDARKAGIAEKTLRRAKGDLGVIAQKSGMEGGWAWKMPELKDVWGTL